MNKLGEILFKYRDYTPIPFVVAMVIWADASTNSLCLGGAMMLFGEAVRFWGVAYIGGVSRTRSYSTGQKVVTGGPFRILRNPLYLGNFFLSCGSVVAANVGDWFTLLFMVVFFAQYYPIIWWEEANLTKVFGQAYLDYQAWVRGRFLPLMYGQKSPLLDEQELKEAVQGQYLKALKSENKTLAAALVLVALILWRSGMITLGAA